MPQVHFRSQLRINNRQLGLRVIGPDQDRRPLLAGHGSTGIGFFFDLFRSLEELFDNFRR